MDSAPLLSSPSPILHSCGVAAVDAVVPLSQLVGEVVSG